MLSSDAAPVEAAKQWAVALQRKDRQQFDATSNLTRFSYSEPLAARFEMCGGETPEALGLVLDASEGRERYMAILRYREGCLQLGGAARTDTVVVFELMMDGAVKVDAWSFGRPPGM